MNEVFILALSVIAGSGLGAFFFIGLWWTIRKGLTAKNPALLFLPSQLLRTATVIIGFYFLSQGHWPRLVCGLFGFLVARQIIKKLMLPEDRYAA
jgi:F1F0 ATPase subunit 2